jgi:hypothetical protein
MPLSIRKPKKESPAPLQVLRKMITNRAFGCQCQAVLNVLEQG